MQDVVWKLNMFNFRATLFRENIELFASNIFRATKLHSMVDSSVLPIIVFLVSCHLECGLRNNDC